MSRSTVIQLVAPVALAASALSFTLMTSHPEPVQADIGAAMQQQGQAMPSLAPMLKQIMPAVVNISVVSRVQIDNPLLQDPFFRRFFNIPDQPQQREAQSIGSGVIVDAAKGYVITNNHVVEQADVIKVRLNDDRVFDAKLIGKDPETDLAVLQIKAENLKALVLADSDKAEVGDYVVAIGSPFGLSQTVTSGIVSGLGRATSGEGYEDFIQTDASINPGNSGGALVNLRGELIGINSQIYSRSGGNIGIGFAIPTNLVKSVMQQLIENGSVQRGRIGIGGQDLTPELAKAFGLPNTRGAVVTQVMPGSPAEKGGLKSEDIILKANGKEIANMRQLRNLVGLARIGERVDLDVLRDGKPRKVSVIIGKDDETASSGGNLHPALAGAIFGEPEQPVPGAEAKGVQVQQIAPGSPAARSGLRPGDVVIAVNRRPVNTVADFEKLAGVKGGELLLHVRRGNAALFLLLQ